MADKLPTDFLDSIHHIAIAVKDVRAAVEWYRTNFHCKVSYQDDTWAMLDFANLKLALVIPQQHPPHLGFVHAEAAMYGPLKTHRDGTRSCYVQDPSGNAVEMLAQD
jgi:catechol 2,3-dioxygenase-like lactoylglutathione lyase family enzyme